MAEGGIEVVAAAGKKGRQSQSTLDQGELWRESTSCPDVWKCALERNIGIDVKLKVGPDEEEILCHKVTLMVHSPFFECKFERWRSLSEGDGIDEVKLPDDDPETFKLLIKFLYSLDLGSKPMDAEKLIDLIVLAKKYFMTFVIKKARKILISNKSASAQTKNCIHYYQVAKLLKEESLEAYFEEQIVLRAFHIFKGNSVIKFTQENLSYFVQKEDLNANETTVYTGCICWAKHQCQIQKNEPTGENMRKVLGDVLQHIRFPNLSEQQLLFSVKKENILTDNELLEIIHFKKSKTQDADPAVEDNDSKGEKSMIPYKTTPRIRCLSLERFQKHKDDTNEVDFHTPTTIQFEVDRDIFITGLGFFGGKQGCKFQVNIGIRSTWNANGEDKNELHKDVEYKADNFDVGKKVFPVYFWAPVFVKARKRYSIYFTLEGSKTYYARSLKMDYALNTYHGKVNFRFIKAKPRTHKGQMPFLYFRFATENEIHQFSKTSLQQ